MFFKIILLLFLLFRKTKLDKISCAYTRFQLLSNRIKWYLYGSWLARRHKEINDVCRGAESTSCFPIFWYTSMLVNSIINLQFAYNLSIKFTRYNLVYSYKNTINCIRIWNQLFVQYTLEYRLFMKSLWYIFLNID